MRSIGSRRYWGGFWGGALGMLAFSWHPFLMPAFGLVGVLAGFYYREIGKGILEGWRQVGLTLGWFNEHPLNKAAIVSMIAVVVFAAASLVWVVPAFRFVGSILLKAPHMNAMLELLAMAWTLAGVCGITFGFIGPAANLLIAESQSLRSFYSRWERYSRGTTWFFFTELALLFRNQVAGFGLAIFGLGIFVSALAVSAIALPVFFFWLFLWVPCVVVARVATRRDHWPCVAVVVLTTTLSGWILSPYLSGPGLWIAALANGHICGAATLGLHWMLKRLVGEIPVLRKLAAFSLARPLIYPLERFNMILTTGVLDLERRGFHIWAV